MTMADDNNSIYEHIKLSKTIQDAKGNTWRPEDYGFQLVNKDGEEKGSKWVYRNFQLIRLSKEEFILKKERTVNKTKDSNGLFLDEKQVFTLWKLIIDSKKLADTYLTKGLRG